jgi:5-methylcytosine-specific restriction protein A
MTKRREFPRSVRVEVIKRSTRGGIVYCEACGCPARKFQIDHRIADAHGGEPVLENAELICDACYKIKNPTDTTIAAKLKRIESKHIGATKPKGFAKIEKPPRVEKPKLPPRNLYRNEND